MHYNSLLFIGQQPTRLLFLFLFRFETQFEIIEAQRHNWRELGNIREISRTHLHTRQMCDVHSTAGLVFPQKTLLSVQQLHERERNNAGRSRKRYGIPRSYFKRKHLAASLCHRQMYGAVIDHADIECRQFLRSEEAITISIDSLRFRHVTLCSHIAAFATNFIFARNEHHFLIRAHWSFGIIDKDECTKTTTSFPLEELTLERILLYKLSIEIINTDISLTLTRRLT